MPGRSGARTGRRARGDRARSEPRPRACAFSSEASRASTSWCAAHRRPPYRLDAGRELGPVAHAMLDLSDGIASDARRIAERSGVKLVVEVERLPLAPQSRGGRRGAVLDARRGLRAPSRSCAGGRRTTAVRGRRPSRGGRRSRATPGRRASRCRRLGALRALNRVAAAGFARRRSRTSAVSPPEIVMAPQAEPDFRRLEASATSRSRSGSWSVRR